MHVRSELCMFCASLKLMDNPSTHPAALYPYTTLMLKFEVLYVCVQAQELQQVLASISGAEQELQALQEQRDQLQPAAKEAAELRSVIAQLQDEVRSYLWCGVSNGV
jgi:uncharacterized protein YlxW (UPF0749 family)